jgi:soluble lytic murein transglycosylase-like protein
MILSRTLAERAMAAAEAPSAQKLNAEGLSETGRKIYDAAEQLEALFVTQLVKASRMMSGGTPGERAGGSVYQGLAEESFGEALARSSDFGITRELIQSLRATEAGGTVHLPHGPSPVAVEHRANTAARNASKSLFADASVDASRRATRETNSAAPGDRQTGRLDKLAARLAPFSEAVADAAGQYGIDPSVITAVIVAESGGKAHAVSPAGARGLMQIMPATGRELGLVNPFDPRENILAGTRYLSRMLKRFGGDITLALAAYNAGPGAVRKHGGIPPYRETMRFVSKVLALAGDLRLKGNSA